MFKVVTLPFRRLVWFGGRKRELQSVLDSEREAVAISWKLYVDLFLPPYCSTPSGTRDDKQNLG